MEGICHACGQFNKELKVRNEPNFPPTVYCPDCTKNYHRPTRVKRKTICKTCLKEITPREAAVQTGKDHYIHVRCILKNRRTDWKCPKCGQPLWMKWTKWRRILSCSCGFIYHVPRDGKQIKVFDINKEWSKEDDDEFIKRISEK